MRHALIQTTMNVYGRAMSSSKRKANGKVIEMVLKPVAASAYSTDLLIRGYWGPADNTEEILGKPC